MAITFKNLSVGGGTPAEIKNYTVSLNESKWLRIAKVSIVSKNSSGIFNFDCYGIKADGTHQILTTSVFCVSCGLDGSGKFVSDVVPINHASKLTSASSDGGASSDSGVGSDGDSGSGGSGESGSVGMYGLSAIKLENFEGNTYVCGLVNFPSVKLYTALSVDMKIENNLNYETLDHLEVVNLDEVIYGAEQVVDEGTALETNKEYQFKIRCKLSDYLNIIDNYANEYADPPYNALAINLGISQDGIEENDVLNLLALGREGVKINTGATKEVNISADEYPNLLCDRDMGLYYRIPLANYIPVYGLDILYTIQQAQSWSLYNICTQIIKVSGTLSVNNPYEGVLPVRVNGDEVTVLSSSNTAYKIKNLIVNTDEVIVDFDDEENNIRSLGFLIDPAGTEIEITIPYIAVNSGEIQNIEIINEDIINLSLILKDVTRHETSKSYGLYSIYEKLYELGINQRDIKAIEAEVNYFRPAVGDLQSAVGDLQSAVDDLYDKVDTGSSGDGSINNFVGDAVFIKKEMVSWGIFNDSDYNSFASISTGIYLPCATKIGDYSFYGANLQNVVFDKLSKVIGSPFFSCKNLQSIHVDTIITTIPENISDYIASDCNSLTSIYIRGIQTYNGNNAVRYSSGIAADCSNLKTITIGDYSDASLSKNNFVRNCPSLTDVYIGHEGVVRAHSDTFDGVRSTQGYINWHVKSEYVEQYNTDESWSQLINEGKVIIIGDYEEVVE